MRLTRVPLAASLTILLALTCVSLAPAESVNDLRYQAFQLYEQGRFREAVPLLDQVIARHHRDIEALIKRGNCYVRLDQPTAPRCPISSRPSTTTRFIPAAIPTGASPC